MQNTIPKLFAAFLISGGSLLVISCATVAPGEAPADRSMKRLSPIQGGTKKMIRSPEEYKAFVGVLGDSTANGKYSRMLVRRQLEATSVVLPDEMVERLRVNKGIETGRVGSLAPEAGPALLRFWRRQDPYPVTPANERLGEHLRRTSDAFEKYSLEDVSNLLDHRGRVYIRYGPPDRSRALDVGKEGEFWVYSSHSAAEYVFVRDRGYGYKLSPPTRILPDRLQNGLGSSRRGLNKSVQSLSMLEHVYERLSHFRSRYGTLFSDLSMYKQQVQQSMSGLPTSSDVRPHTFVQQKIQEIRNREAEASQRRKEVLPRTQSEVGDKFDELPIATRWIRSLSEAGSTQVELYWGVPRAALQLHDEQTETIPDQKQGGYLFSSSLVQFALSYERKETCTRHLFTSPNEREPGVLGPRRMIFSLENTPHAALQVDMIWASVEKEKDTESLQPQAKLKVGTSRVDSLSSLSSDPSVLEMSDLRPVLVRSDSISIKDAPIYPFQKLPSASPLALRFDIYHLSTNADGHTRYSIEYEVLQETDRGNFKQFLLGDGRQRTAVESRAEGSNPRTKEFILLDTSYWAQDGVEDKEVRVTVTITDERTGQQVSRDAKFELTSKD